MRFLGPIYGDGCPNPRRDTKPPYCTEDKRGYTFWYYDGKLVFDIRNLRIGVYDNCDGPIGIGYANVSDVIKKRGLDRGSVVGIGRPPDPDGDNGPYRDDAKFVYWERVFEIFMDDAEYTYTDGYTFVTHFTDKAGNVGTCYIGIVAQWDEICIKQPGICPKTQREISYFPCGYDPNYPPPGYPANPSICDCLEYYPLEYHSQCAGR